jgi:predicted nucleic acid-binding protein
LEKYSTELQKIQDLKTTTIKLQGYFQICRNKTDCYWYFIAVIGKVVVAVTGKVVVAVIGAVYHSGCHGETMVC